MRARFPLFSVLSLLLIAASPADDERWRARNDRGNRYEGITAQPVSAAPLLDLIGLHAVKEEFTVREDAELYVTYYGGSHHKTARITAREIKRSAFYWMEAKPSAIRRKKQWNEFGPWPIREVLRPNRISSGNLAVLVSLDGNSTIAPAFIRKDRGPMRIEAYEAHFVVGKSLQDVKYRLIRGNTVLSSGHRSEVPRETPLSIVLPLSGDVPPGPLRVEVVYVVEKRAGSTSFYFEHPPYGTSK
jgi:hypothetical protein